MVTAADTTATAEMPEDGTSLRAAERVEVRRRWIMVSPALVILMFAALGPLAIMVVYSFLTPASYGGVVWQFSTEAWFRVVFERDIFDGTVSVADAHLSIFWRSARISLGTTVLALAFGFPTAYFIATRPEKSRGVWLFLVTIPFWTNLLIRTFAIQEVIRNEGIVNSLLIWAGVIATPIQMLYTDFAIMLGMLYVFLPLMVLPLYASMEKLDFRIIEAGYDLYASRFQVLRRIILPLVKPGYHRRVDPGLHPLARVLCDAAGARRRAQHDDRQPDRAAVRAGAQLAARRGAVADPAGIVLIALLFYIRAVSRPEPHHG
jgi:spermidine/putrescine transport system permease protein